MWHTAGEETAHKASASTCGRREEMGVSLGRELTPTQPNFEAGFDIKPGDSPIVPIMLYDAALSQKFANQLLEEGVYAIGFFYPVVAKGQARIRTQISAAHTRADLDKAIAAFIKVGKNLGVIQ